MRLRLDAYRKDTARLERRALAFFVAGGFFGVVAAIVGFVAVLLLVVPPEQEPDTLWARRSGFFVGTVDLLFPGLASVLFVRGALRSRRSLEGLRQLAIVARQRSTFDHRDVARALGVDADAAERVVLDAIERGLLDGESTAPPALEPDAWIGRVLDETYRIDALVGRGGMGAVFAATHLRTGGRYAIKTILPAAATSIEAIRRFEREATAASAIGHAHIAAVHDFRETPEGLHFLVMDLLVGETLEARLARVGTLPWPAAKRVTLEIGSALVAAHVRGLLHRDVKPANVFLATSAGAPERAILLDFGLAKPITEASATSRITRAGAAVGTPLYMSPEQARGEATDARSDLYALGSVLFEMLAGTPPFFEETVAAAYARLLTEAPPRLTSMARTPLPPALDDVVAGALASLRDHRFANVAAFLDALARVDANAVRSA